MYDFKGDQSCHKSVLNNHASMKKKIIRMGDFLHLGHDLLRDYSKATMHEYSLTQNLLEVALKNSNSKQIVRVNLLIGPFSHEREESIELYWKDLSKGSQAEGAELHFEHVKAEMKCLDCSGTFYLDENEEVSMCKFCKSEHLKMLSGDDIKLESIEVE